MGYPDFEKPFELHTDASQEGLGAVLYQKQEGHMQVIGYASKLCRQLNEIIISTQAN